MDSQASFELRFLTLDGQELSAPQEWMPCFVEVLATHDLEQLQLLRGRQALELGIRKVGGALRVVAEWPRSGAGRYELKLQAAQGTSTTQCYVRPEKLSQDGVDELIDDLQRRLPASVAIGLQQAGALTGLTLVGPQESTLAEELNRLRRACEGTANRPGLLRVLALLAGRHHAVLQSEERWTARDRAHRIHPSRLPAAFQRPKNLEAGMPLLVPEQRVQHTADVYENRLVLTFLAQVDARLRRLTKATAPPVAEAARELLARLRRTRAAASFLDEVSELSEAPTRITMVLARRPEYRAALEGFLEFRRSALVQLHAPELDAPIENLPRLYEIWGTLQVIQATLDLAGPLGYRVRTERLTWRRPDAVWIHVLRDGRPAVELEDPNSDTKLKLIPQRTYPGNGVPLRSTSFDKRPDIAIEVSAPGETPRVWIFDPKYKLRSELTEVDATDGRPKSVDIDGMHTYRDAIRTAEGARAVEYAAILYPGGTERFDPGIAALRAQPGNAEELREAIVSELDRALILATATSPPTGCPTADSTTFTPAPKPS
jgi:hypothetical protein